MTARLMGQTSADTMMGPRLSLYRATGLVPTLSQVARWQPNARERLTVAALDLFKERGYDNTTVIDIAERAG